MKIKFETYVLLYNEIKYLEICINKFNVYILFRNSIHPVYHTNVLFIIRRYQLEIYQNLKQINLI